MLKRMCRIQLRKNTLEVDETTRKIFIYIIRGDTYFDLYSISELLKGERFERVIAIKGREEQDSSNSSSNSSSLQSSCFVYLSAGSTHTTKGLTPRSQCTCTCISLYVVRVRVHEVASNRYPACWNESIL